MSSGVLAVSLIALILVFAHTAPAAQVVPIAKEHCLDDPHRGPPTVETGWSFQNVAAEANISHVVAKDLPPMGRLGLASSLVRAPTTETHPMDSLTGGIAVGDADGDGWDDFYVADVGPDRLYRNLGDGTFEDVAPRTGLADPANGRAALWFDMDDDGDADLFVANFGAPHRLWRNDGNWTFVDVSNASGVAVVSSAHGLAAADVDRDGDLDVSVSNYGDWPVHPTDSQADSHNGEQDLLFINGGNGTFTEEAVERGIVETKWTFSHAWSDFDRDGDADLYVNVDFGIDELYENDGTGRFRNVAPDRGMFTDGNGMGAVWVDYDNDLDLDLFATAIRIHCNRDVPQFAGNDLFQNDGTGRFTDVAAKAGIADGGWGWDSEWIDLDHDGDLDAFQANGWSTRGPVDRYHDALTYLADDAPKALTHRNQGEQPSTGFMKYNATKYVIWSFYPPLSKSQFDASSQGGHQVDRVWINDGGTFKAASPAVGVSEWTDSRALAAIDFDRDGDLDILRSAWHRNIDLLRNPAVEDAEGRHWIALDLEGTSSNRDAVGAIVTIKAGDVRAMRVLAAGDGFLSQGTHLLHFGLGGNDVVDEIVVSWPSGAESRLTDVAADRVLALREP